MALYSPQADVYPKIYLSETDQELPQKLDTRFRYIQFKTIARGGTCVISACKDLHLRRTVCHKALRAELEDNKLEQARFLREARVTAMLQHPNTIPTYELGRDMRGHYYFTMKLVHGETIREILRVCMDKRTHTVPGSNLYRLVSVLSQVCHALHYAHEHGVVHRDIKPENVLIGAFGEVLVLDWGLAKVWSDDSRTSTEVDPVERRRSLEKIDAEDASLELTERSPLQGTLPYMSPEQLVQHNVVDHRADIYSIGAILFEVLALDRMISGDKVLDVREKIEAGVNERPSERNPSLEIPELLEDVCMRCVATEIDSRYSSMKDVIEDLEVWLASDRSG